MTDLNKPNPSNFDFVHPQSPRTGFLACGESYSETIFWFTEIEADETYPARIWARVNWNDKGTHKCAPTSCQTWAEHLSGLSDHNLFLTEGAAQFECEYRKKHTRSHTESLELFILRDAEIDHSPKSKTCADPRERGTTPQFISREFKEPNTAEKHDHSVIDMLGCDDFEDLDDPKYDWRYFGRSKYGRYAFCVLTQKKRGLTMGEFYGTSPVD